MKFRTNFKFGQNSQKTSKFWHFLTLCHISRSPIIRFAFGQQVTEETGSTSGQQVTLEVTPTSGQLVTEETGSTSGQQVTLAESPEEVSTCLFVIDL